MIEALAPLFRGELESFGAALLPADDPTPGRPGRDLTDPAVLADLLARFALRYQTPATPLPDQRAVASLWAKWHFTTVAVPTLLVALVLGRDLPVALDQIAVVEAADGRISGLKIAGPGLRRLADDGFARLAPLLDDHLAPVIAALVTTSGITAKVLWSNLGNLIENVTRRLDGAGLVAPEAIAALDAVFARRDWPGRGPNPLFMPVRYLERDGERRRVRRLCCLRYLIPELAYCGNCPLPVQPGRAVAQGDSD